jgi:hypothetical protein
MKINPRSVNETTFVVTASAVELSSPTFVVTASAVEQPLKRLLRTKYERSCERFNAGGGLTLGGCHARDFNP